MRKFTLHAKKGKSYIMEVECELIRPIEDPSILWSLNPGEYKARILAPDTFHQRVEKVVDGKKEVAMVPDVWCWHAFCDTLEEAKEKAALLVRQSFAFDERKYGKTYTEEEVLAAIAVIEVVMLKA